MPERTANMEAFLANLRVILPGRAGPVEAAAPVAVRKARPTTLHRSLPEVPARDRHRSRIAAMAVEEEGEFVVLRARRR
jgi:hypothetical protein